MAISAIRMTSFFWCTATATAGITMPTCAKENYQNIGHEVLK